MKPLKPLTEEDWGERTVIFGDPDNEEYIASKNQILSAKEWFKEAILNHNWNPDDIKKDDVINLIDEAFPITD